jgi:hypothetical protein
MAKFDVYETISLENIGERTTSGIESLIQNPPLLCPAVYPVNRFSRITSKEGPALWREAYDLGAMALEFPEWIFLSVHTGNVKNDTAPQQHQQTLHDIALLPAHLKIG